MGKGKTDMRTALKIIGSKERHIFYGTFDRYGVKNGYKGTVKTVLLTNIENENHRVLTTHLWFNLTKGFKDLDLKKGDKVKFCGRIKPYLKGYIGRRDGFYYSREMDYLIEYPTKVAIVKKEK